MKLKKAIEVFKTGYQSWSSSNHEEEEKIPYSGIAGKGDTGEMVKALKSLYVFLQRNEKLMKSFPDSVECGSPKDVDDLLDNVEVALRKHLGAKAAKFYNAICYTTSRSVSFQAKLKDAKLKSFYKSVNGLGVFFKYVMRGW